MKNQVRILITGDFCPVNRINDLIAEEKYDAIFNDLLPIIKDSNLAITNLECPLTTAESKIQKTGPLLKASTKAGNAMEYAGFGLVTLANNHIMDYGLNGLQSTIETCKENGVDYVGAGTDYKEARKVVFKRINGLTLAILNFAENEFSTTHGAYPGANPQDIVENFRDISHAKSVADYVIVIAHSGHEMYDLPSPRIKNTFHFYAEAGASAIIGHHTHCYSGYEVYKNVPIFYSLGNFVFDIPEKLSSSWNLGFAVELTLKDKLTFNIIPYDQCSEFPGVRLLDNERREIVLKNIYRLNSIITDDKLLSNEFKLYCSSVKRMYLALLEPHSIEIFHFLRNRKLFPSLLSTKKKALYLNLMRCESHRDVLIKLLNGDIL